MEIKNWSFAFFIFLMPIFLLSQGTFRYEIIERPLNVFILNVIQSQDNQREYVVQGSPYLTKEFKEAKWILKGQFEKNVTMRYDAYRDNIQLIQNGEQVTLSKDKEVEAEIDGKLYQFIDYLDHGNLKFGYMNPLHQGNTVLYLRNTKVLVAPYWPEHGYEFPKPPKFESKIEYYLKQKNKPARPLQDLSRKEVFSVLWDKYSELRKYAKQKKLNMRTEEEVTRVLKYYDTLKSAEQEEPAFEH